MKHVDGYGGIDGRVGRRRSSPTVDGWASCPRERISESISRQDRSRPATLVPHGLAYSRLPLTPTHLPHSSPRLWRQAWHAPLARTRTHPWCAHMLSHTLIAHGVVGEPCSPTIEPCSSHIRLLSTAVAHGAGGHPWCRSPSRTLMPCMGHVQVGATLCALAYLRRSRHSRPWNEPTRHC